MSVVTVRRKPDQTTAIQWTGENYDEVVAFSGGFVFERLGQMLRIGVLDVLPPGGWLVMHVGMKADPYTRTWFTIDDRTFQTRFEIVPDPPVIAD